MKITMLGTGCAVVTECYNTCFVLENSGRYFLVDGGGGGEIFRRLKLAGIDCSDIHDIFLTHKHLDHIFGVIWLVRMACQKMAKGKFDGELRIYGHDEASRLVEQLAKQLLPEKQSRFVGDRIKMIVVNDGETKQIIGRDVAFFDIASTKAKQFGFAMILPNGRKLVCCGDEPFNERNRTYVENAQWLLHEAFCLYSQRDIFNPYEKNHSTVKDACETAERLGVENLILYHTEDSDITNRKTKYGDEGRDFYRGALFVPDDLETIEL